MTSLIKTFTIAGRFGRAAKPTPRATARRFRRRDAQPIWALYLRAWREARSFRLHLLVIFTLGLMATPLSLLGPLPIKLIIDNVVGSAPLPNWLPAIVGRSLQPGSEALFEAAIGLSLLLVVLTLGHRLAEWMFREWVAERLVHGFRGKVFLQSLQSLALGRNPPNSQDLAYRISYDSPAIQWTAIYGVMPVINALVTLVAMLSVTASISAKAATVALVTSVPMVALIHWNQGRLRRRWHGVKEQDSAAQAIVQEVLGAVRLVASFGQERRETRRFLDESRKSYRARLQVLRAEGVLGTILALSTAVGTTTVIYLCVRDVQAKILSVGDLLLITAYIGQLLAPLQTIGTHITGQQQAIASAQRVFGLLDEPPSVVDRESAPARGRATGAIALRNAAFGYEGREPVLRDLTLDIPAGSCVGIVGKTGSGKSTLVNLLIRLFDPTEGAVLLDGVDLRDWRLADLRRQFAVVSQEPILFSTTIAENIAYGKPGAAIDDIIAAAKLANAHTFIAALPDGYHTRVGERGALLSGGERQRIALARAILVDAPILILDEPTSAIDNETELAIVDSLEQLVAGRTIFLIAHRLSTLRHAVMVIRVVDGRAELESPQQVERFRRAS